MLVLPGMLGQRHTVGRQSGVVVTFHAGCTFRVPNLRSQDAGRTLGGRNAGRTAFRPITALLAPSLQVPAVEDTQCPSPSLPTLKASHAKSLWGSSQHVQAVGVSEAEELYLSLVQRTNEQHVLMVLYAPWCPHCQGIEQQVERLAAGLAHERSLSVVALNCDSAAARYFSKEVLGVHAMPSFVLFPRESRTFFKYKGKGRDAESLLKFLNMVCNQSQDRTWQLGNSNAAVTGWQALAPAQNLLSGFQRVPWPAIFLCLAAVGLVAKLFLNGGQRVGTDTELSDDLAQPSTQRLGRQIDRILSRMGALMLKLAGARVSLQLLETQMKALGIEDAALQAAARASHPSLALSAVSAAAVAAPAALPEVTAAVPAAAPADVAASTLTTVLEAPSAVSMAELAVDASMVEIAKAAVAPSETAGGSDTVEAASTTAQAAPRVEHNTHTQGADDHAELSMSTAGLSVSDAEGSPPPEALNDAVRAALEQATGGATAPKLTADQVLQMLDEEGDVEKVVQKLMSQHITPEQLPEQLK